MAVELIVAGIGVAEKLLGWFLDHPERELRRRKLELEIDALVQASLKAKLSKQDLREYRAAALDELALVAAQLPDVDFRESSLGVNPVVLSKPAESQSVEGALSRLEAAIEARRRIVSSVLENASQELNDEQPDALGGALDPMVEWPIVAQVDTPKRPPLSTESSNSASESGSRRGERLTELERRIVERRQTGV